MSVLFLHHPKETDLALFAGGELGPLARWRIERHIQSCAECEDAVADFFHLQGDVSELAELPPVDWAALSLNLRQAVAEARAKPAPEPGGIWHRPLVWQAGLASAALFCTFVVVRQFSPPPQPMSPVRIAAQQAELAEEQANPAADSFTDANREQAPGEQLARQLTDGDAANRAVVEPESLAPAGAVGASRFARLDENAPAAASERDTAAFGIAKNDTLDDRKALEGAKVARSVDTVLPGDAGARSTPGRPVAQSALTEAIGADTAASTPAAEKAEAQTLAVARRNAPPPAAPPSRQSAANERESNAELFRGRAGQRPTSGTGASPALRAELKAAPEAEALADRAAGQASNTAMNSERGGAEFRQSIATPGGPGFSVPPGGLRVDTTVAADGGISYRSVDSRTGTITIYDVYAP